MLQCTLGDRFLGGLFDLSLLKTLLSSLVKHTFTNINDFLFFLMFVSEHLVLYTFLESQLQISFLFSLILAE